MPIQTLAKSKKTAFYERKGYMFTYAWRHLEEWKVKISDSWFSMWPEPYWCPTPIQVPISIFRQYILLQSFFILLEPSIKWLRMSMGRGKIMVEFFSADMCVKVCKNLSCRAAGDSEMTSEASFRALEAFISPSAETKLRFINLSSTYRFNQNKPSGS